MADINVDQLGPVDYVVVGFPADKADFSEAPGMIVGDFGVLMGPVFRV